MNGALSSLSLLLHMKGIDFPQLDGSGLRVGLVVARWNSELTYSLRDAAVRALKDCGMVDDSILIQEVPGSYELVYATKMMIEKGNVDAVICIGVLIKGETMHFEYISDAVGRGIMELNLSGSVPVVYGVLNCITEQQARARSTSGNNHGYWWGKTAIEMAKL